MLLLLFQYVIVILQTFSVVRMVLLKSVWLSLKVWESAVDVIVVVVVNELPVAHISRAMVNIPFLRWTWFRFDRRWLSVHVHSS